MIPFSILDLAPIAEGSTLATALENSTRLAIAADKAGFNRIWYAEHHGMQGIASSATSIVISHIAAATESIRVCSGGIMLPNHSPLVIAEQFGTLAALFPDRIDLGLGRAPGTDMRTAQALRRNMHGQVDDYPSDIQELQGYLGTPKTVQPIIAIPGVNSHVPLWLLGSSLYSAQLSAELGLPYSFASHFAPDLLFDAISLYRAQFKPSKQCQKPYVMAGMMAILADTNEEAAFLFTSVQQQFINLRRGVNKPFARPVDNIRGLCSVAEEAMLAHTLRHAVVGSTDKAQEQINRFIEATDVDEIIFSIPIHDIDARLKSLNLLANNQLMQKR
jgi:luciferase family oxidoreductase group 1